ncbi:MAG: MerR family transcriptional regulator, partial [Jiangellaceae bacterium]
LKDLGLTLQQVGAIVDERIDVAELQGMLRLRRAELAAGLAANQTRLNRVEARISIIEKEGAMPTNEIIVKTVAPVRLAELSAVASGYEPESIGPVVGPLFDRLGEQLEAEGMDTPGPGIAWYEPAGQGVLVHAGFPVQADLRGAEVATLVYHGSMDRADTVVQELARWIEANGYRGSGFAREVYLECPPDRELWVTEFQEPVVSEGPSR